MSFRTLYILACVTQWIIIIGGAILNSILYKEYGISKWYLLPVQLFLIGLCGIGQMYCLEKTDRW